MIRLSTLLLAGVSLSPVAALAQALPPIEVNAERAPPPAAAPASEPAPDGTTRAKILNYTPRGNDLAAALGDAPGVSLASGGGVSSLPVIHGLNDDRNAIVLGGVPIASACANHMNPPLSYIDPLAAGEVEVLTANVPVSKGGDSIGGAIIVKPRAPIFAAAPTEKGPGFVASATVASSFRSNNGGVSVGGHAAIANDHFSLSYDGAWSKAGDYHAGGGAEVRATRYEAQNHSATLAYQNDGHLIAFRYDHQYIPYQGFPNQYMDMLLNRGNTFDLSYKGAYGFGRIEANAYYHLTQHYMNFLAERVGYATSPTSGMPMYVNGQDFGYRLKAEIDASADDLVRLGSELHLQRLNEWWPTPANMLMMGPGMMCCGTYVNVNDGRRDVLSTYAEWERRWSPQWSTRLGLRNDVVWMNAGDVQGYSVKMYGADAAAFNARSHDRTDINFDLSALARYAPSDAATYEFGYTRKTRSPALYERYTWATSAMAAHMIGWFGDGNGYVGDVNLKPEVAHSIAATGRWGGPDWSASATPYYSYVQDFIDVDYVKTLGSGVNATNLLRFANHDAELYGFDLSGRAVIARTVEYGDFSLSGRLNYVRGRRTDGLNLYHMAPLNGKVALENSIALFGGRLTSAAEVRAVAAKTDVQSVRLEPTTPSFAVFNLRAAFEVQNLRFDLGVENLADKLYYEPLGGVDVADWRAGAASLLHSPLAAQGRTVYGGVTVKF